MGGLGKYVTCHISEFFLYFLFSCLHRAPRSHSLNDGHDRYAKKRVSGQGCASWGLHNIRLHLGGQMQNKVKGSRERVT